MMRLSIGVGTHQGRTRSSNQDSVGVFAPPGGLLEAGELSLFVVADGMGGHKGGEFASHLAVQAMGEAFPRVSKEMPLDQALGEALQESNRVLLSRAKKSEELHGMGTTVVAATVDEEDIYFVNVGDSRGYFIRDEEITQITEDHSLVAEQVRMGQMTKEQAETAQGRNVITRAVGRRLELDIDLFVEPWGVGDAFLLCSDGLWGPVTEAQMLAVLMELDPQPAAEKLLQMAMTSQAPDNVSVIIVRREE